MPELPEIETLARQLRGQLSGLTISAAIIREAGILNSPQSEFEKKLPQKKIENVSRRGKFLRIEIQDKISIWFHLGMTGQLVWKNPGEPFDKHSHFALNFAAAPMRLVFRDIRKFGGIALSNGSAGSLPAGVQSLGPEPFEMKEADFVQLFKKRKGRLKSMLMNQRLISGLGNIYADESLHLAGIDPRRRPGGLTRERLGMLYQAVRSTLEEAIRLGGSSIDDYVHTNGSRGEFQKRHQVYGRFGEPCFKCGSRIRRIRLAGRSACFCPQCQR